MHGVAVNVKAKLVSASFGTAKCDQIIQDLGGFDKFYLMLLLNMVQYEYAGFVLVFVNEGN